MNVFNGLLGFDELRADKKQLVYFANDPDFLTSGGSKTMSIHTEDHLIEERELHHAQENHEDPATDCEICERFDIAVYNGYINGLEERYEEVGQYLEGIEAGIDANR